MMHVMLAGLLLVLTANTSAAQLAATCAENSPERRGGIGCSIIDSKRLPEGMSGPMFWHIDRFDSLSRAQAAVGPAGVAFDAFGAAWLMTIEATTSDHHGGGHVARVGPLPLPKASKYAMQAFSVSWTPGLYSLIHHHSGVEAFYVVGGEQCLQTPERATRVRTGGTLAIPAGVPMRVMATGTGLRQALAVLVHDAERSPTMRIDDRAAPKLASCR